MTTFEKCGDVKVLNLRTQYAILASISSLIANLFCVSKIALFVLRNVNSIDILHFAAVTGPLDWAKAKRYWIGKLQKNSSPLKWRDSRRVSPLFMEPSVKCNNCQMNKSSDGVSNELWLETEGYWRETQRLSREGLEWIQIRQEGAWNLLGNTVIARLHCKIFNDHNSAGQHDASL